MPILTKISLGDVPLPWLDTRNLRDTRKVAHKNEIYLQGNPDDKVNELINLFDELIKNKDDILIYDVSWWDFCICTWDIESGEIIYDKADMPYECRKYLDVLLESDIPTKFSGSCYCNDWNAFLSTMLECIVNHLAPYSHLFYDIQNEFVFYFHHTGSIGLFYKEANPVVNDILNRARILYEVV